MLIDLDISWAKLDVSDFQVKLPLLKVVVVDCIYWKQIAGFKLMTIYLPRVIDRKD